MNNEINEYEQNKWIGLKQMGILTKNPANIYLFKVNNRNTRKRCLEIRSKLTTTRPE